MYSSLSSIPDKETLLELFDIDEKCWEILTVLALGDKKEHTHNKLRKYIEANGFTISERTFSDHLTHLEEKNLIIRDKQPSFTFIKLNDAGFISILYNNVFTPLIDDYDKVIEEAKKLTIEDIYSRLEYYSINKSFVTLYFKLNFLLSDPFKDKKNLFYNWIGKLHDNVIEIYLDEIKNRGIKDTVKTLSIHASKIISK